MKKLIPLYLTISLLVWTTLLCKAQQGSWAVETTSDGNPPGFDEISYVKCGEKFYLIGGRGNLNIVEYDPASVKWTNKTQLPFGMHHFQAVDFNNKIYIIGAYTGDYPNETPIGTIYIYDPATNTVSVGDAIPDARKRGSAGAIAYNNKIYVVCGITNGHIGGNVAWFDEYNPTTGEWKTLTDAPRARDHFNVAVYNNKLYLASGRTTVESNTFGLTVAEVDIYDFQSNSWSTAPNNLPTLRGAAAVIPVGNEIWVIGGESTAQTASHNEVEALDATTLTWKSMPSLKNGRHSTQAILFNNKIYIASGVANKGGTPGVANQEIFTFGATSITDKSNSKASIYPNPFSESFSVNFTSENESYLVELFDSMGKKVIELRDDASMQISTIQLQNGWYTVKFTNTQGETFQQTLLKVN